MAALIYRTLLAATLISGLIHSPVHASTGVVEGLVEKVNLSPELALNMSPEPTVATPFGGAAIASATLEKIRGGSEVSVVNDSHLAGVVGQNQAHDLVTGNNVITDGSMAGASGFSTVIQNSGNNVLIQNSTIINLQVK